MPLPYHPYHSQTPWSEVDTVGEDTQTNAQVDQFFAVVPFEQQFSSLFAALTRHMREEPNDYKVRLNTQQT